jgi:hypothetical protein
MKQRKYGREFSFPIQKNIYIKMQKMLNPNGVWLQLMQ